MIKILSEEQKAFNEGIFGISEEGEKAVEDKNLTEEQKEFIDNFFEIEKPDIGKEGDILEKLREKRLPAGSGMFDVDFSEQYPLKVNFAK